MTDHVLSLLADARATADVTDVEADAAWGSSEQGRALPQAEQLRYRIHVGEAILAERPDDPDVRRTLARLRAMLRRAERDRADVARCEAWRAAHERFVEAELLYKERRREAVDIYHVAPEQLEAIYVGAL